MSVNLRDKLFSDTGGVIQNATVQAYLVTGGGTDAGTGSVLQASTTTDVNGVWKFSALPDPGAGNWYDVKIINGNQVRWRYGNIQAVIQSLLLQSTVWASPHFTAPVVDSGGLTVTAGGLTVTAGNAGIGVAPSSLAGLTVNQGIAAANAYGIRSQSPLTATAGNATLAGLSVEMSPNPNGQTNVTDVGVNVTGFNANGSANAFGVLVGSLVSGGVNNIGVQITAPTGASRDNISLFAQGDVVLGTPTGTTGTTGFTWISANSGAPTGVPALWGNGGATGGYAPLRFDASNNKLWIYTAGGWKGVVLS